MPAIQMDVSGRLNLAESPEWLRVTPRLDLADSGVKSLPASIKGAPLRRRGAPIDERIAFRPETITVTVTLAETKAELRRVSERIGYEFFLNEAEAETLDRDRDPGGARSLSRVPMEGDKDLVCVPVVCPSTVRRYVIRARPTTRSCRQAAAMNRRVR